MATTPTLQDLIAQLPPTLGQGLMSPAEQQAEIDRITAATMPAALRKYGDTAQQIAERYMARMQGSGSYDAYQQALNTLMQQEGTAQIQNQAKQSVDAAQRAAVGNATNYATSEQNRASQEANQRRQIAAQRSGQNKAAIIAGLGNLGGGTAATLARDLMRPEGEKSRLGLAGERLKGYLGFGGTPEQTSGYLGNTEVPSYDLNAGKTDFGTGNLSDYSTTPTTNFGTGSISDYNLYPSGYDIPKLQLPEFSLDSLFGGFNNIPSNFWDQEL